MIFSRSRLHGCALCVVRERIRFQIKSGKTKWATRFWFIFELNSFCCSCCCPVRFCSKWIMLIGFCCQYFCLFNIRNQRYLLHLYFLLHRNEIELNRSVMMIWYVWIFFSPLWLLRSSLLLWRSMTCKCGVFSIFLVYFLFPFRAFNHMACSFRDFTIKHRWAFRKSIIDVNLPFIRQKETTIKYRVFVRSSIIAFEWTNEVQFRACIFSWRDCIYFHKYDCCSKTLTHPQKNFEFYTIVANEICWRHLWRQYP